MNYIERKKSVLTGKEILERLYVLRNFPVFFGTVDTPATQDLHADMEWGIDPETGVIQLTKLIPLDILYSEQHVDGCGPTWKKYYEDFADYIAIQRPAAVVEIGGGAGVLAKNAVQKLPNSEWTIVEPNPTIAPMPRIDVIKGFFSKGLIAARKMDAVVFSQVMEHVYDPREFIADIAASLERGQKLIFAYPNLALWLSRYYTNALNFEHTMLLTDRFIDVLLPQYGFKVTDKSAYKDHSFFYTAEQTDESLPVPPMPNLYKEYKAIFQSFVSYHEKAVQDLNKIMRESSGDVYLFGAHIFSTFLFAFGLDQSRIKGILDNSPTKRGRRLYGTRFVVVQPDILKDKADATVILRAGIYNDEIKEGIVKHINPAVRFV